MRFTNRLVYKRASAIVAIGSEMKRHMLESHLAGNAEHIRVIPNWYDGDSDAYCELTAGPKATFNVVYSGNMGICQDIETIIRCAELLRDRQDIHFIFTGHGSKVDDLKQETARLNLQNVKFHGYLMGQEYTDMLTSADCFVVSLEKGIEGLAVPSKTYSYLATGRPVLAIIAKDTDTSKMLGEYHCGRTTESGDAAGMARWILEMAADRTGLAKMGGNARRLYEEHYKREICTGQYVELLKSLLEKGSGVGGQ